MKLPTIDLCEILLWVLHAVDWTAVVKFSIFLIWEYWLGVNKYTKSASSLELILSFFKKEKNHVS